MRINLVSGLVFAFFLSGCVTTPSISEQEVTKLQNRIQVIESELKETQDDNLRLKEKIAELERTPAKMPTGKDIQTALKNAGFYQGEIDGQIGTETKEAIKKFQQVNSLNSDGVIGSRTWEILVKYLENKTQ